MDPIIKTMLDLIQFKTTADRPSEMKKAIKYVKSFFRKTPTRIKEFRHKEVSTLLISVVKQPRILLNGHLDVVPAQSEAMFAPKIRGGKVYGRGANDMKGALAGMMHLMKELGKAKESVGLLITTDEETGGVNGCKHVLEQGLRPTFFLSGEPTDLKIGNQAKGVIQAELIVKGKGVHAATPWEGESAILKMCVVISKLQQLFPKKGDYYSTINFGKVAGGEVINKVADACSLGVDIRYVPKDSPNRVLKKLRSLAEVKVLETGSPAYCAESNPFLKALQDALKRNRIKPEFLKKHAASDARHFTEKRIPAIVFGPKGHGSHAADEYVEISSLIAFYKVLKTFCSARTQKKG